MKRKVIINFTPTGLIPTRAMTHHVPILPEEIVEQVNELASLGVNMVHLHAREPDTGLPSHKKEIYARIIAGIREKNPDLVLCVSTSGRIFNDFEKRSEVLDLDGDLKPDFGSLTLSSLNFNKQTSVNDPEMIKGLARKMLDRGIKPELEVFDHGMINYAHYLIEKGLLTPPYYFNLILGNIACAQANMLNLGLMIKELPPFSFWSVGGIGRFQLPMNVAAITFGGGVRVGLEDNIWFDEERTQLATNRKLVERVLGIAETLESRPYSARELRDVLLQVKPG
jgi:3-keto-5-aminohexanoate cleavage enzyme